MKMYRKIYQELSQLENNTFLNISFDISFDFSTQVLQEREMLPVKKFEPEILEAISQNSVVIIRGATGCGKTTQVPQYILDDFIQNDRAAECNIVVTQVNSKPM